MAYENEINYRVEPTSVLAENQSFANPAGFRLVIDNLKYPNAQYNVQAAAIPDLSVPGAAMNTPKRNVLIAADKVEYAPLTLTFLVDENFTNYQEIHDWMFGMVGQADFGDRKTRDLTLIIYNSSNNVVKEIQFVDAHPTSLSSLPFEVTNETVNYLTAVVEFSYSYYKFL
jgi:hypothetical protein